MKHSTHRCRRGFTLVEVLVVMAILVLLAGLVATRVLGTKKRADINATQTQISALKGALERYAFDMNDFPTTEQGLIALIEEPDAAEEGESGAGRWDGPYLNSEDLPVDPWKNQYQYEYPPTHGKGKNPEIWSYGPDEQDDTDDDIVSWKKVGEGGDEFLEDKGTRGASGKASKSTSGSTSGMSREASTSKK